MPRRGLTSRIDDGPVPVLVLAGPLTLATAVDVEVHVRKLLMDRGSLLVDVRDLEPVVPSLVALFTSTLSGAGGWPAARLVLVAPSEPLAVALGRSGVVREIGVAANRGQGLTLLGRRPARVRRRTELPDTAVAVRYARALVREACREWELTGGIPARAELVADELVANAVVHGGGRRTLLLTLDGPGLRVGVRDEGAGAPDPESAAGQGLHVVAELSDGWGTSRHAVGKTVWALLRAF
ncbi:ATP-binding protein [Pseudonocardia halophobica]|uniref:Sulfate transporter n=1 Tax=Pseudonocardia halophobica TaxID=29401 RepID=A0A9W6P0Q6_9PSEU|nr:ATP-binding protein [Pseudonocardia halophobica]GLL15716.1 sulfate transporter [Pseudonocardia halophobica]